MPLTFIRPSSASRLLRISCGRNQIRSHMLTRVRINLESSSVPSLKFYLSARRLSLEYTALNDLSPHLTSSQSTSHSDHLHRIIMMSIRFAFPLAAVFLALAMCVSADISVKAISVARLDPNGRVTNCVFCPPGFRFRAVLNDAATGCRKRRSFQPLETNECGETGSGNAVFCENTGSASQRCTCRLQIRCAPILPPIPV